MTDQVGTRAGDPLDRCVFCLSRGPFSRIDYSPRDLPREWPSDHCFVGKTLAECGECGGAFLHQVVSEAELDSFYSAVYATRKVRKPAPVQELHELNARFLSQALYLKTFIQLRDGMQVLELGPNVVSALPALSLFCRPEYYYFDQVESPVIAHYGGQRLGSYGTGASIVGALGKERVDLVYASHSLEHVNPTGLDELLNGISAALKPGGFFFFEVPDDLSTRVVVFPHTLFFTYASIDRLLRRHGLVVSNLSRWGAPRVGHNDAEPLGAWREPLPAAQSSGARLKRSFRSLLLRTPIVGKLTRSLLLQRALLRALKRMPTPYDQSVPFFRVIARKESC